MFGFVNVFGFVSVTNLSFLLEVMEFDRNEFISVKYLKLDEWIIQCHVLNDLSEC